MRRVTKPVEERRQEILETARALFCEIGYKKTQIQEITRRMNVAQGLVYHYFKSKSELLYAVIDLMAEENTQRAYEVLEKHSGSTLEVLELLFEANLKENPPEVWMMDLADDQAIVQYCKKKMIDSGIPILTKIIERGNEDGSWRCPYPIEIAGFILHGMSAFLESKNFEQCPSQLNKEIHQIILRVLGRNQY